ncbi:hypothetical protein [Streptomyces sp. KE1]|nr:hypothetical protein [Streptomyces sp. KE1]
MPATPPHGLAELSPYAPTRRALRCGLAPYDAPGSVPFPPRNGA